MPLLNALDAPPYTPPTLTSYGPIHLKTQTGEKAIDDGSGNLSCPEGQSPGPGDFCYPDH